MILRLSQQLAKKAKIPIPEVLSPESHPFGDWHLRTFKACRVEYLLVTHSATLYSNLIPAKGIKSQRLLQEAFWCCFMDCLRGHFDRDTVLQLIMPTLQEFKFSKAYDRQVIGSMNEITLELQTWLESGLVMEAAIDRANDSLYSMLGLLKPAEAFRTLVSRH